MRQSCTLCRFVRVLLLGAVGALTGAWLAPSLGYSPKDLIMPATLGVLVALGLGILLFRGRL